MTTPTAPPAMTSRERVKRAVHFQGPDRVPCFLPDQGENDIQWLWFGRPAPQQDWVNHGDQDRMIDAWGSVCYRAAGGTLGFGEVLEPAIPDIARQADYRFPDLHRPEFFNEARTRIAENARSANPKYNLGVMPFASLFEAAHKITMLDRLFIAFHENPDEVKALIARFAAAQRESIRILHELGCDGVMGYDDLGVQDRLLIGPKIIEEFFLPHFRANWAYAHELGMDVWLHSCGYIIDILPRLADAGLNVAQLDQQENMGLENLSARLGGKLAFWSPVDIQKTMIEGSVEDVRRYCRRMVSTLGGHHGGFIAMAYSSPQAVNHTPEKLAAMCAAFREAPAA